MTVSPTANRQMCCPHSGDVLSAFLKSVEVIWSRGRNATTGDGWSCLGRGLGQPTVRERGTVDGLGYLFRGPLLGREFHRLPEDLSPHRAQEQRAAGQSCIS